MKHLQLLAALAFAATVPLSGAVIITSVNIPIPTDFTGVYVDLDTGATSTSPIAGWDINPFFGGSEIAFNTTFQPVRVGTNSNDAIINVANGSLINGTTQFYAGNVFSNSGDAGHAHMGAGPGKFETGEVGLVAFSFMTNSTPGPSTGPHYGFLSVTFTNNTPGGVITHWGIESTPGVGIVVPEPSTYAALAGVAVLGLAWNRRRRR